MKIFLYTGKLASNSKKLLQLVTSIFPDGRSELFNSIEDMVKALQTLGNKPDIVILMIANFTEMQRFSFMKNILPSTRLILVLPDRDRKTIAMAHKLYPRFISYGDNCLSEVGLVLEKISRISAIGATGN